MLRAALRRGRRRLRLGRRLLLREARLLPEDGLPRRVQARLPERPGLGLLCPPPRRGPRDAAAHADAEDAAADESEADAAALATSNARTHGQANAATYAAARDRG